MPKRRMLEGTLSFIKDITDLCFTTGKEYGEQLIASIGVKFPINGNEDFLVYGFQTPSEDQKGKLWYKTDKAGHFQGFFQFIDGKWQRIYDYSIQDVIWKYGNSREIEPGFQLIDGSVASIPTPVQIHIMGYYHQNAAESTPSAPVYDYFATIYLGL